VNRDYKPPKQTQRVNITSRARRAQQEKKREQLIEEDVYIKNQHQRTTKNKKQKTKREGKKQEREKEISFS
jgi:hypothetical protein